MIRLWPATLCLLAISVHAAERPRIGEPPDFVLPAASSLTLDNGLRVTLVSFGTIPKVTVSVRVRAGNLNEGDDTWLADLSAQLLKTGAGKRTARDIASAAAAMGGDLDVRTSPDYTTLTLDVLSTRDVDAVDLLGDVVMHPGFPASELSRVKSDLQRDLDVALSESYGLATGALLKLVYGDTVYGRAFPTREQLDGYTIGDVRKFHEANFGAARTHVYVVGQFDEEAVVAAIRRVFSEWRTGPEPLLGAPVVSREARVQVVDRPGAAQASVYMGLPVIDPGSKDYIALEVTDALLGGSFGSRIAANIRQDKGYAYATRSTVSAGYRDGLWTQVAEVDPDSVGGTVEEIYREIRRLQVKRVSDDELDTIKRHLAGVFILRNASRGNIANQLAYLDLHGLDAGYFSGYVSAVSGVSPGDVRRLAREQIVTDDIAVVVVGDADVILPRLRKTKALKKALFVN